MAGMAAAEAAPWLVVRLRGVLCTVEAHSSRVGHWPAWRPQWAAGVQRVSVRNLDW